MNRLYAAIVCVVCLGIPGYLTAQEISETITTLAGNDIQGFSGDGAPAAQASLNDPTGVAVDTRGNVYVADSANHCIRRVGKDGVIATVAGMGTSGFSGDGEKATLAHLNFPTGVAVDAAGAVYIADTGNNRIRRVGPNDLITTVAGSGAEGFSGDGGPATQAALNSPYSVAVDVRGNLYIADLGNERVRRVGPGGLIATAAGKGTFGFAGDDGPAAKASLNTPCGVAVDAQGNLYIADRLNNRIRRVEGERAAVVIGASDTSRHRR